MSLLGYVTSVFDTYDFTWLTSVGEFDSLISCTVADKNIWSMISEIRVKYR